jgi:phospho-N-acetylmuramoyl-pentapeptide-transferase
MEKIVYSVLVAFFISLILGPILIPLLHRLKFGQNIREEGPQSHQKKAGTPTMGGIVFIIASFITMAILIKKPSDESMVALYAFIAFGVIGALDDGLKIIHKKNLGLRAAEKMILLLIVSLALGYYAATNDKIGTTILIPFMKNSLNLGIWYVPFIVIYFAGTTNAVNLTDGLDGLATSITLLVMTFFALVSFGLGHWTLAIFCGVIAGSLLGFLRFNAFPAQVFMGDTGSLALGGAVAAVAMILKLPLLVIIVGGIYVLEALSVILQVASFKLTKKRIFKMAPLHLHFELSGMHETRVVAMYMVITVAICVAALLLL